MDREQKLSLAVHTFLARQDRSEHPQGHTDNGGRWYPSDDEWQSCCNYVRSPSRSYPWSYMLHCRTATHIANLYGVSASAIRKASRQEKGISPAYTTAYKAVAVVDGRYFSIFDGITEYTLNQEMSQSAKPHHESGYYVYKTIDEAINADIPLRSALRDAPRAILEVQIGGKRVAYDNNKRAVSRLIPVKVINLTFAR